MKKCLFCQGNVGPEGRCIHCGRIQDLEYEEYVRTEQAKEHTGQHTYGSSADYKYRKKMKLPLVDERGRKSKWE